VQFSQTYTKKALSSLTRLRAVMRLTSLNDQIRYNRHIDEYGSLSGRTSVQITLIAG
jgi:hypothetical protein